MSITPDKTVKRRRSSTVPLTLVPALAALITAAGCASNTRPLDPCDRDSFSQAPCDSAVAHHGYWYSGVWYPRVYPYSSFYYYGMYNSYVRGGGVMRSVSPTVYAPSTGAGAARPSLVRGGFGGIGEGHASAGS
jgi:hypothetical protein